MLPHTIPVPATRPGAASSAITLYFHPNTQDLALVRLEDFDVVRFPDDLPPHPVQLRLYDTIAEALASVEGIKATDRDDIHTTTHAYEDFAAVLAVWTDDDGIAADSVRACVELVDRRAGAGDRQSAARAVHPEPASRTTVKPKGASMELT